MRFSTLLWIAVAIGLLSILLVVHFILGIASSKESFLSVQELQAEVDKVDVDALPDPATLLKGMRGLLDKYDRPEYVEHARRVMRMDPGELARMHLGAQE
jgi:hypothetical protein